MKFRTIAVGFHCLTVEHIEHLMRQVPLYWRYQFLIDDGEEHSLFYRNPDKNQRVKDELIRAQERPLRQALMRGDEAALSAQLNNPANAKLKIPEFTFTPAAMEALTETLHHNAVAYFLEFSFRNIIWRKIEPDLANKWLARVLMDNVTLQSCSIKQENLQPALQQAFDQNLHLSRMLFEMLRNPSRGYTERDVRIAVARKKWLLAAYLEDSQPQDFRFSSAASDNRLIHAADLMRMGVTLSEQQIRNLLWGSEGLQFQPRTMEYLLQVIPQGHVLIFQIFELLQDELKIYSSDYDRQKNRELREALGLLQRTRGTELGLPAAADRTVARAAGARAGLQTPFTRTLLESLGYDPDSLFARAALTPLMEWQESFAALFSAKAFERFVARHDEPAQPALRSALRWVVNSTWQAYRKTLRMFSAQIFSPVQHCAILLRWNLYFHGLWNAVQLEQTISAESAARLAPYQAEDLTALKESSRYYERRQAQGLRSLALSLQQNSTTKNSSQWREQEAARLYALGALLHQPNLTVEQTAQLFLSVANVPLQSALQNFDAKNLQPLRYTLPPGDDAQQTRAMLETELAAALGALTQTQADAQETSEPAAIIITQLLHENPTQPSANALLTRNMLLRQIAQNPQGLIVISAEDAPAEKIRTALQLWLDGKLPANTRILTHNQTNPLANASGQIMESLLRQVLVQKHNVYGLPNEMEADLRGQVSWLYLLNATQIPLRMDIFFNILQQIQSQKTVLISA